MRKSTNERDDVLFRVRIGEDMDFYLLANAAIAAILMAYTPNSKKSSNLVQSSSSWIAVS